MTLIPPTLGVRRKPDAEGVSRPLSEKTPTKSQIEKAMRRDDYTCRCCGFRSEKFQRVFQNGPASAKGEVDPDSLITVCAFCERCLSLDQTVLSGGGILVWLPEISQADLHHLARALYVARASGGELSALASRALDALLSRRAEAKKRLGTDDPLLLATAFHEAIDDAAYRKRDEKLQGIRLFPYDRYLVRGRKGEVDAFPQMVSYWTSPSGPFAQRPVSQWKEMFEQAVAKTAVAKTKV